MRQDRLILRGTFEKLGPITGLWSRLGGSERDSLSVLNFFFFSEKKENTTTAPKSFNFHIKKKKYIYIYFFWRVLCIYVNNIVDFRVILLRKGFAYSGNKIETTTSFM